MGQRLELHAVLLAVLELANVYFQPPPSVSMKYPCIVYSWSGSDSQFANNSLYATKRRYQVTVIDRDPDTKIPDRLMSRLPCGSPKNYTADGLNHYSFDIYY